MIDPDFDTCTTDCAEISRLRATLAAANERIKTLTDGESLMRRNAQEWKDAYIAEREVSDKLEEALNEINNWLVCAAIATPDDMAQSFQPMQQLADAALAEVAALRAKEKTE